jgi:hypothetical protein
LNTVDKEEAKSSPWSTVFAFVRPNALNALDPRLRGDDGLQDTM